VQETRRIVRFTRGEAGAQPEPTGAVVADSFVGLAVVDGTGWYLSGGAAGVLVEPG
jgi:hypothetical protein